LLKILQNFPKTRMIYFILIKNMLIIKG